MTESVVHVQVHDMSESEDSDATIDPDITDLGKDSPDLFNDNSDQDHMSPIKSRHSLDNHKVENTSSVSQTNKKCDIIKKLKHDGKLMSKSKIHSLSDEESHDDKTRILPSKPQTFGKRTCSEEVDEANKKRLNLQKCSNSPVRNDGDFSNSVGSNKPLLSKEETLCIDNKNKSENAKRRKMPLCKYGSKCYRKNPSHLKDFSHSGDEPSTSDQSSQSPPRKRTRMDVPSTGSPSPGIETFTEAQPFSFFLTKVAGIDDKYNSSYTMNLKDILSPGMGNLVASCQFNYMFEIEWLVKQYPTEFRKKPLLIVHGFQGANKTRLEADAMSYGHIRFCQARLEMTYGTHHTKMMFLLYDNGMRVVIHTANLIQRDWFQKTQGIWVSPVFPKLSKSGAKEGDSKTHFKHDLLDYLSAYRAYQMKDWTKHIQDHDMSSARVHIISSVPGRHTGERKTCFGHLKLRKVLQENGPKLDTVKSWPVIGQFSSIGSLGPTKDSWCRDWLQSLSAAKGSANKMVPGTKLILIFPSKDNVRQSLEGYPAGQSIPYSINNAKKQAYIHSHFV
ncbi:hypothetical protein ScPMuIL_013893 [Solemya velum]